MYQKEILNQSKTLEEEKNKAKIYEENLRQDIKDKQQEIGEKQTARLSRNQKTLKLIRQ